MYNTNTQHYDLTMSSLEPTIDKTIWGDITKLIHVNYDEWKDDMILTLSSMRAYAIVTGDDPEMQPLDFDHNNNCDDWEAKKPKPYQ